MKAPHQMNILLVAEEAAGVHALRLLANSDHNLSGVLTTFDSSDSAVSTTARSLEVPIMDARRIQVPAFVSWMDSHHR